jgi:hypothetical protein
MKRAHRTRAGRAGFTLVELLVVIAIIIILVGLISAAAIRALAKGRETVNTKDIRELAVGIGNFQTRYKVPYIPSRIILCETQANYFSAPGVFKSQLFQDSYEYIMRVWPRLNWGTVNPGGWTGIDWDGNGAPSGDQVLEGEECLVFFLGGIQSNGNVAPGRPAGPPGTMGFSTNPLNPAQLGGSRDNPFFEFQSNRLVFIRAGVPYYSYLDPYGRSDGLGTRISGAPYAYFSSYKSANNYNRYYTGLPPAPNVPLLGPGVSDCATLGLWPFAESATPVRYLNPSSFQIISAGPDSLFGPGSDPAAGPLWSPANASNVVGYQDLQPGHDDMSNFHDRPLGISAN